MTAGNYQGNFTPYNSACTSDSSRGLALSLALAFSPRR